MSSPDAETPEQTLRKIAKEARQSPATFGMTRQEIAACEAGAKALATVASQAHTRPELEALLVQRTEELRLARGAITAQDERERQAGERCGVSRDVAGCDWPEAMAEEIARLRTALQSTETVISMTLAKVRDALAETQGNMAVTVLDPTDTATRAIPK